MGLTVATSPEHSVFTQPLHHDVYFFKAEKSWFEFRVFPSPRLVS